MASAEYKNDRQRHLFDSSELNVYDDTILNLGVGAPGTDLLENCCTIFQKATEHCLKYEKESNQSMIFQYGPTSGNYNIRLELSKFFTKMYSNPVNCEDLIITTGATQGLHFVLSTLLDLNGYVFVDEFTYMLALDAIQQFNTLKIVPVKLTDEGVDLVDFELKLKDKRFTPHKSKEFWAMYYAIPTYHNPTGINFSPMVCRGIVEMARKYDILVICDDVYNILHYRGARLYAHLFAYDGRTDSKFKGNVISNGSFSKIVGPGIRLGWLEVPPRLKPILERSGILNSGGCFNNYTAGIAASLFELNLIQPHIAAMCRAYKDRMFSTLKVLSQYLPKSCVMIPPDGGYFIWIKLPINVDAKRFLKYCVDKVQIYFITGDRFALEDGKGKNHIRISIAFHKREKLIEGTRRLCEALVSYIMEYAKLEPVDDDDVIN